MKNVLLLVALLAGFHSFATVHTISVADFSFSPASAVTAHPGDTILWTWASGTHTTTSTTIPGGATAWNSSITSSVTSFRYIPTVVGTYNYECTIHASMGMTGSFVVVSGAGVDNVNKTAIISAYPNPVSKSLHIQFNNTGSSVTITLEDMNGKQVLNRKFKVLKDVDIDVQDIPNGNYVLYARQGNNVYNQQLVISH